MPWTGSRRTRAPLWALLCVLALGPLAPVAAQPFTPAPGAPSPPPPGGAPFVPPPGTPPQTLPQQKVAEVVVRGNAHIPTGRILAVLSTKPNDQLNEERLRNDVQSILALGDFADAVVQFETLPEGVRVVFLVVENPVVAAVEIKGNTVIPTAEVARALAVPAGAVLNTITMRAGARAVEKVYADKGYTLARVSDIAVSDKGVLTITIAEGRIEAVKITGLTKVREYVVRRELTFKAGDVFNANEVNVSLKRLFQLQYFSDIKADPGPGTQPDTVDVTIAATEQKTGAVSFGAGYSTTTGIEGIIGYRDIDFGGNGQVLNVSYNSTALYGGGFTVLFREPYFLGAARTALEVQAFNVTTIPTDFSRGLNSPFNYNMVQTGGQAVLTQPIGGAYSISYGVKSVNTQFALPSIGINPPANFPFTPGTVNAVLLGAALDTRNDPVFPTDGERAQLSLASTVGGDFTFQKYDLDWVRYFPMGGERTIAGHFKTGAGSTALPLQEQYYLGGQNTLRGYTAGRFRGDEFVLLQGEYRFPLSDLPLLGRLTGVTAIVFGDAGDAEPFGSGFNFNVRTDVGVGVAIKTGIGAFRLDYGFGQEGGQFWISTGASF